MKSRQDKIIIGCNLIKGLINDERVDSSIFKTAAKRLISLIQDEMDGKDEVETVDQMSEDQVKAVFTT